MGKRGRPPHPDILTPREWQVLDLLRQDLTNEQIAQHLDISFATAKYHVAEILSKLGVSTREEAAAWRPEAVPVRWWQRATAWVPRVALPLVGAAVALAAAAGLALLAWGVWRTNEEDRDLAPATGTTVADVHSGIKEAITQDGMVLYATVTTTASSSDPRFEPTDDGESKSEFWIDPVNETARTGYSGVNAPRDVVVYTGGRFYYISGGPQENGGRLPNTDMTIPVSGLGPMCDGVGGVSALLIDYTYDNCPDNTEVLSGNQNGVEAVVIKHTWVFRNEDGDPTGGERVTWLYFDRNTYLPLGSEFEVDGFAKGRGASSVALEFVPRDSLSDDFFAPESIGYIDRCAQFRIQNGGPACYLAINFPQADDSLKDPGLVIDATIRLATRKSVDIADRSAAQARIIGAAEAIDLIEQRRIASPYLGPPSGIHDLTTTPPDKEVWFVEVPGVFGDRGGSSRYEPNPPLRRGTLLAIVVVDGGAILYSDVAF